MTWMAMLERIQKLRDQERRLVVRRKALEARLNRELKRHTGRQMRAIGSAILAWMRVDDMARRALPHRLKPYIHDGDRELAEAAFRDAIEAANVETGSENREVPVDAQS